MADQEMGQKSEGRPVTGYYVFMGLVLVVLVIIVGYVVQSYLVR
ncbi:MAG: hypothetical protein NTU47_02070 [Ignavibacteriales bacterium]|nr:hypothetical protein [Ignavibacteriales bacterium]